MSRVNKIVANWTAPDNIIALCSTRLEGNSLGVYAANNLGLHVGDEAEPVLKNRAQLKAALGLSQEPQWLEQTHSTRVVLAEAESNRSADAAVTRSRGLPLAIMTADCLPILLCNRQGDEIAAIHAGWKGLLNGVVENTLKKMQSSTKDLLAWIGPAICQNCFEVGTEVWQAYKEQYPFAKAYFREQAGKYRADLPKIAEQVLRQQGVDAVFQSAVCTFEEASLFYSYRRENETGRMVSLIWIK